MGRTFGRPGGGGGSGVDTVARANAAAAVAAVDTVAPSAGNTVADTKTAFVDGKIWQNTSGGNAVVPTPATEANMIAAPEFVEFSGGSSDPEVIENAGALVGAVPAGAKWGIDTSTGTPYRNSAGNWAAVSTGGAVKWNGIFTANQAPASGEFVDGVWKGTFSTAGGNLEVVIPAGMADGDEVHVFTQGGGDLVVKGTGETVAGFSPAEGATLNIDGSAIFKKSGGNWAVIQLAPANAASPDTSTVAPGQHYFSTTSGWWSNGTVANITLPNTQDVAAMSGAGLTQYFGLT